MMQDYIENENGRLEREQQFWSKEIVVKIEYKYCPNLTIIDTPGGHVPSTGLPSSAADPHCLKTLPYTVGISPYCRACNAILKLRRLRKCHVQTGITS